MRGNATSMSVENITPLGIWLFVEGKEYLLSYEDYPYFKDQVLRRTRKGSLNRP